MSKLSKRKGSIVLATKGETREEIKEDIVAIFRERLKYKTYCKESTWKTHCGSEGHWLEEKFGIDRNSDKEADYKGFELKKNSRKVTIGDWTADEYLYSRSAPRLRGINGESHLYVDKNEFIRLFGYPNDAKQGRFAWSGRATPKYNKWNECGQSLVICPTSLNIYALYSFEKDRRATASAMPDAMRDGHVVIAMWYAETLRRKCEAKWNRNGFFQILKNADGEYVSVLFGKPFDYEYFIDGIKKGLVIFDSGMVENQNRFRNCSKFRVADNHSAFMTNLHEGLAS